MKHSQHRRPLWLGVLVAPWAAPSVFTLVMAAYSGVGGGFDDVRGFFTGALLFFAFGVPFGYAAVVVLGLPYVLWLRRVGRLSTTLISVGAAVAGGATFTLFWANGSHLPKPLGDYTLLGALLGLASGLSFAAAVGPNNSSKPTPLRGAA